MPPYNISSANTPIATAKIRRSTFVFQRVNMRAPVSDPVSTPNITGIASPGWM